MIKTITLEYRNGDTEYEGFVAWDDSITERRPVVMVTPSFRGQSEFENEKAMMLAEMGYVGFAIDIYGKGRRGGSPEEASALMNELNSDRERLLEVMRANLKQAMTLDNVDSNQVAAIGFCFGGKCVLDLARSGEPLRGVVTFHGVYDAPEINADTTIKSAVLILHGYDDPLSKPEATMSLADELTRKGAHWEIDMYGHTGHAFTNPKANSRETGLFYREDVTDRAWQRMTDFLEEVFD